MDVLREAGSKYALSLLYVFVGELPTNVSRMSVCLVGKLGQTNLITWCSDFFRKIKERLTEIKKKFKCLCMLKTKEIEQTFM